MRIYAIRISVKYGEYVHIVSAKSKASAIKQTYKKGFTKKDINEVKVIKLSTKEKTLFFGGCKE